MKRSTVKKSLLQQQQVQVVIDELNHPPHVQQDQSQGQGHQEVSSAERYMEVVPDKNLERHQEFAVR